MTKILDKKSVNEILSLRFCEDFHTKLAHIPSPMVFKDMEKAASRIKKAWQNDEKIVIVGDYDADGIISSVILSEFFDLVGIKYQLYIPNRFKDGYGLNAKIVEKFDVDLIITVDNGITANEAALMCKDKNCDLIITDHHAIPNELPNAYAIVNPKQENCDFPCSEICGAQVAWYLCASIKEVCSFTCNLSQWLDVLSVAIVADMMELKDINRVMVKSGLSKINQINKPAFKVIKDMFNKPFFQSDDISFLIAPLINSTGRMDDAMLSYHFLRSKTYEEAMDLLEDIARLNNLRKTQESLLYEASLKMIDSNDEMIIVWGEDWHEGVIGIVASRLSRQFKKPAIVFSLDGDRAKGSARSVGEVDILSLIHEAKELLIGCGGHKGAAGVSITKENLPLFKKMLNQSCAKIDKALLHVKKDVIGELDPEEVDHELLDILKYYEPYGEKNPKPSFILRGLKVQTNRIIGKQNNHLLLSLKSKTKLHESLFFNFTQNVRIGEKIDILATICANNFKGNCTPQLLIQEIL